MRYDNFGPYLKNVYGRINKICQGLFSFGNRRSGYHIEDHEEYLGCLRFKEEHGHMRTEFSCVGREQLKLWYLQFLSYIFDVAPRRAMRILLI